MRTKIKQRDDNVIKARIREGLTLGQLSERSGVCRSALGGIEAGKAVAPGTAYKVATSLNCKVEDLFCYVRE